MKMAVYILWSVFFNLVFILFFLFLRFAGVTKKSTILLRVIIIVMIKFCKKDPVSFYVVR